VNTECKAIFAVASFHISSFSQFIKFIYICCGEFSQFISQFVMQRDSEVLIALSHVHLYFVKRSMSESIAGVLNLFSPIPHFLVGQLSIFHHSIGL